jgi:hypothetical protein
MQQKLHYLYILNYNNHITEITIIIHQLSSPRSNNAILKDDMTTGLKLLLHEIKQKIFLTQMNQKRAPK